MVGGRIIGMNLLLRKIKKLKAVIVISILEKNKQSAIKQFSLKEIDELKKFKDETVLSIYIGECKKLDQLVKILNTFKSLDGLRIFYLGEAKDYHLLVHFHFKGFKAPSYKKLSKINVQKLDSKRISRIRSLCLQNYPLVSNDLTFLKNFINLRKLSLTIFGDKDENPIDLSILGEIKVIIYEGISFLNLDFRFFPSKDNVSIKTLKNSKYIERLSLISNFQCSLIDLEVLASMKKLKFLCIVYWQSVELLDSLLNSKSLEVIYLDPILFNQVDKSLRNKFKKKNIEVLSTDISKEKIFGNMGLG